MKTKNKQKKDLLKNLIAKWDKKLADSGFRDIEDRKTGLLKEWSGTISIGTKNILSNNLGWHRGYSSLHTKEAQAEYFRQAARLSHTRTFKTDMHKVIWKEHVKGKSLREIAEELELTRRQVRYAINNIRKDFGLSLSRFNNREATKGSDHAATLYEATYTNSKSRARRP